MAHTLQYEETAREIEVEILKPIIMTNQNINVALIGNPNTGKTSVLIKLTGLNQQVGNYPGITVEKRLILQITQ
jgi:ribosome biogenesis GTPase A